MIFQGMNISSLVQYFRQELVGIYPQREVEQIIALVFESVLNFSRVDVVLQSDSIPEEPEIKKLQTVLNRLLNHEPIQYVLGKTVFYGLPMSVNSNVLIPRPETEELVHWILKEKFIKSPIVIDLGTGTGCIPIAIKDNWPTASVYGVDVSVEALNTAKENADANDIDVDFFHFDILERESLGFMKFDLMVSNPPYVLNSEVSLMERNVLDFEPYSALFVSDDEPLIFYRKIMDLADGHLRQGGKLFFEINEKYGQELKQLMMDRGYTKVELKKDLNGKDRMLKGTRN